MLAKGRPERFGVDAGPPVRLDHHRVEPQPLGTGGAIKFAAQTVQDSVIVLNGDVLQAIDLQAERFDGDRSYVSAVASTPEDAWAQLRADIAADRVHRLTRLTLLPAR